MNIKSKMKVNAFAFVCAAILMGFQSTSPAYHPDYDTSVTWPTHVTDYTAPDLTPKD